MNIKINADNPRPWLAFLLVIFAISMAFSSLPLLGAPTQAYGSVDWKFWRYEHLKNLDPWGDAGGNASGYAGGDARDIVAVYVKEEAEAFYFRVDLLDARRDSSLNVYLAIDYRAGGKTDLMQGKQNFVADIAWDVLFVWHATNNQSVFDTTFANHPEYLSHAAIDNQLDFVEFSLNKSAVAGWHGAPFQVQVLTTKDNSAIISDKTMPVLTNAFSGRAKLVLAFQNMFNTTTPGAIGWYDGFALQPDSRPGERRGLRYLLDACEKYELPFTTADLRVEVLAGNDFLSINNRIRDLTNRWLFDALNTLTYGYYFPWQPDDVDAMAIKMARDYRAKFDIPPSQVFYPYEAWLTAGDLANIKNAGYDAIYAMSQYYYWFGWEVDWGDPVALRQWWEAPKKIHLINGVKTFFGFQAFYWDARWNDVGLLPGWHLHANETYIGTDAGLHHGWRRVLLDMALDADQEKYMTLGTDVDITSWLFADVAEWNARWLGAHPWIEVTTFSDLLSRNWTPVDHGDLGLAPDQPLDQYPRAGTGSGIAYFWDFYYGGIADGQSPLIAKGDTIEGYFDYVPYLRDGERIPSGKKMGDDRTPGTIVYETLHNLRAAPDNDLTRLAWFAYFINVCEQTFHAQKNYASGENTAGDPGGKYLHPGIKVLANNLRQVNKIVAAAEWADKAAKGSLPDSTRLLRQDLDLDGEDEYVLMNNNVYAGFENDGGRLEMAFAVDPTVAQPVQLIAPRYQFIIGAGGNYFADGEAPWRDQYPETAFEDKSIDGLDYSLLLYSLEPGEKSLTFISPDGKFSKTFSLTGNVLRAHYDATALDDAGINVGLSLAVNLATMFSRAWWEGLENISTPESVGWRYGAGGLASLQLAGTLLEARSFSESPAGEEMRERDPGEAPYPPGHGLPFPINQITIWGKGEFDLDLTLSANPEEPLAVNAGTKTPAEFRLEQNFPNPFNPATVIEYQLAQPAQIEISIFNMRGQKIATLVNGHQTAGRNNVTWNGIDAAGEPVASGVYFYRIQAGENFAIKKMLLLR